MIAWLPVFAMLCGLALLITLLSESVYQRDTGKDILLKHPWLVLSASGLLLVGGFLANDTALIWRLLAYALSLTLIGLVVYARQAPRARPPLAGSPAAKRSRKPVAPRKRRLTWVPLLVVTLVAPILWFPTVRPDLAALALELYALMLILGAIIGTGLWPRSPFDIALLLLIPAALAGGIASNNVALTLPKVTSFLLGIGLFYAILQWRKLSAVRLALVVMALLACGFVIIGLPNAITTRKVMLLAQLRDYMPRMMLALPGTQRGLVSMNQLAGALLMIVPVLMALLLGRQDHHQDNLSPIGWILALLGLLLMLTTLLVAQSRGAWGGLVIGAALVLALSRAWGKWIVGLAAILAMAAWVFWGRQQLGDMIVQIITAPKGPMTPLGGLSITGRLNTARIAITCIAEHPWTGCGWGTLRGTDLTHTHNALLQVAYDMGLVGLTAYLALVMLAVRQCWGLLAWPPGLRRSVAVGALGAMTAYHVYGLVDVVALGAKPGVLWWCLLALIAANAPDRVHTGSSHN